jgi:hypothetical protein
MPPASDFDSGYSSDLIKTLSKENMKDIKKILLTIGLIILLIQLITVFLVKTEGIWVGN